jgi:xylan 1,4-beta-xylosidase
MQFINPLDWEERPDPSILTVGSHYYITHTNPRPFDYKKGEGAFPLLKVINGDFSKLENLGYLFPNGLSWLYCDPWAPDLYFDSQFGYTVTFSGRDINGKLCIGIAFSDDPEVPYQEIKPGPFLTHDEIGVIDSHIFFDPKSGKRYFFWKEDWNDKIELNKASVIWMQELILSNSEPLLIGERRKVIENDLEFEGNLVEGFCITFHDNFYYLFYSSGPFYNGSYLTSVAKTCSLDNGKWTKIGYNILLNDEKWEGRGHGFIMDINGSHYFLCHGYKKEDYSKRLLLLFGIDWGDDGWPRVVV